MTKTIALMAGATLVAATMAVSQLDFRDREEDSRLEKQTVDLFTAMEAVVAGAAAGTVEVRVWRRPQGYGTVVAPERVLAKWSEVRKAVNAIACRSAGGAWLPATVEGIYRDDDLAVLKVEGLRARPVAFAPDDTLELGDFLALARPDAQAAGMGVVSVLPRSLRHTDRAFLGIEMDLGFNGPGIRIQRVRRDTGAARAGLRRDDIITGLNGRATTGNFELSSALQRLSPGETVSLKYRRGDEQRAVRIVLGGREDPPQISRSRMERMNRLGGQTYNEIRDGFRNVIQTDMQIEPEDCGAPVVNLRGEVVGVAIARAGRIKSFVLPSGVVTDLLGTEPEQPAEGEMARVESLHPGDLLPREAIEDPFESMRKHMEDMRRLMEQFDKEFGR